MDICHGITFYVICISYFNQVMAQADTCRSKLGLFGHQDFPSHACSWCYFYLFPMKPFKPTMDHHLAVNFNGSDLPLGYRVFPDITNASSISSVCSTLTRDECDRWTLCCKAGTECCQRQVRAAHSAGRGNNSCRSTWDGYGCWDDGTRDTTSTLSCPTFLQYSVPTRFALKTCQAGGHWLMKNGREWTDYTPCLNYSELKVSIFISLGCQIVSLILLIPAVVIFLHFK